MSATKSSLSEASNVNPWWGIAFVLVLTDVEALPHGDPHRRERKIKVEPLLHAKRRQQLLVRGGNLADGVRDDC